MLDEDLRASRSSEGLLRVLLECLTQEIGNLSIPLSAPTEPIACLSGAARGIPHFHTLSPPFLTLRNSDGFGLSTIPVQDAGLVGGVEGGGGILDDLDFFILR